MSIDTDQNQSQGDDSSSLVGILVPSSKATNLDSVPTETAGSVEFAAEATEADVRG